MTLFLGPRDLAQLFDGGGVTPAECVDAVEASFREHGAGDVGVLPRAILTADGNAPQPRSRALKLSASYMRGSRVSGASLYTTHFRPGDVDMWITLFDGDSGRMRGILCGKALSLWKTGATAATATRHLARHGAEVAALVGTGRYALAQLRCLAATQPLREIRCYSRNATALAAFVDDARRHVPHATLVAAPSAEAAVRGADVVTTITTSPAPVVEGTWLDAGSHLNAMGQHAPGTREVDDLAIAQARVFVDAREQALAEKGELLIPMAAGVITAAHVRGELGEVIGARVPGRLNRDDRTVFCSGGTALEYMGLCALLLDKAQARGLGQRLDAG